MNAADRALGLFLRAGVALYRVVLSPLLGGSCRYRPSCSVYAEEALRRHGGIEGARLAARRILRCRPGVPGGDDPVPGPPTAGSRDGS